MLAFKNKKQTKDESNNSRPKNDEREPLQLMPQLPAGAAGDMSQSTQDSKLLDALRSIREALTSAGIEYVIIGSAAAAFRGADIEPADVDVAVKSVDGYREVCRMFGERAINLGASRESALEVPMAGMTVEFLNPEIGRVKNTHARGKDYYVIDKMDILSRACSREKGVRLKEIKIISAMLGGIDFSEFSFQEKHKVMESVHAAAIRHLDETGARTEERLDLPESPVKAIAMLKNIEELAASQAGKLTDVDHQAIAELGSLEEKYADGDIEDDDLEKRIKELYSFCSEAGSQEVYKLACSILGDTAPQPESAQ
ncbi:hypothetical protein [Pluralibacter sp.]|jgi:hypothetical protein|uniref:hypothetical protein n=1 Tax=Pluralibacter sp. TaxID=1920032 RepID=UPI0025E906B7|nr:hypothetical protein [Pluralibacter sp.]MBV8043297.1 hypothetical protein [Pluralibacter sp.]